MLPNNIMALLQSGSPLLGGPIQPQNPQPGFRAPAVGQMPTPGMRPADTSGMDNGLTGLAAALARMPSRPAMQPSTSGATMGAAENNGYSNAAAGIAAIPQNPDGTIPPPPMPTNIGYGQGGGPGSPGWLQQLRTALRI